MMLIFIVHTTAAKDKMNNPWIKLINMLSNHVDTNSFFVIGVDLEPYVSNA